MSKLRKLFAQLSLCPPGCKGAQHLAHGNTRAAHTGLLGLSIPRLRSAALLPNRQPRAAPLTTS